MKYIKYIISVLAVMASCLLGGCSSGNDSPEVNSAVVGEWHLTEWSREKPDGFDVYLELMADGKFNIWQHLDSNTYERLSGTFSAGTDFMTGCYNDGEVWNSGYGFSVSADGNTLTLTSDAGSRLVSIYTRSEIPSEVRNSPSSKSCASGFISRIL